VGSSVQNCSIVKNLITNIDNVSTSGCGLSAGILISTSQPVSNILIANNMITDIKAKSYSGYSYFPAGIAIHNSTGGIKIYHNTINLFGNYAGYNSTTGSADILVNTSYNNIDIRNNILLNSYDNTGNGGDKGYAIYSTQSSGATFSNINYNDYYVSGPNVIGYLSGDKTSLSQMQSSFGGNLNSIVASPVTVDSIVPRLAVVPGNVAFLVGTPLSQVTVDYDDTLRSTINPVLGAHEVKIPPCNTITLNAGTLVPGTPVLCTQGSTDILPVGAVSALNLTYQWLSSVDSSSWSLISGATSRAYTTPVITGSMYYRLRLGCALNGMFDSSTKRVIVNPSRIQGDSLVCQASSMTLTDSTSGGTWSSAASSTASVVGTTGVVTGVTAGTVRITYTVGSCYATKNITVNPLPANMFGVPNVCEGATTTLVNTTGGGVWSSDNLPVATIATSGVVSGLTAGIANITYQLPTTCRRAIAVSVNPVPVMSVSPSPAAVVCIGDSATFVAHATLPGFTLLGQNFNSGLGAWSANLVSGPATSIWQIFSSGYNSTTGDGTPFLASTPEVSGGGNTVLTSPSFSTVGYANATLTFNQDIVSISSDDIQVGVEYSINNGSSWSPLSSQMDVISETYTWVAATPQVSVSLPGAALNQPNVKLRWVYNTNFGFYWAIDNIAVKAALPTPTYTWTAFAPATGISCTTCDSIKVAPSLAGINLYSVSATTASGCMSTGGLTSVLVNQLPGAITGTLSVCEGAATTLSNPMFGGSWFSGDLGKATVNSTSGIVTGVAAGTVAMTYSMPTGCRAVAIVTVNGAPAAITGINNVCTGFTTVYSTTSTDGGWTSSASGIAAVAPTTGVITGNASGVATISYTNLIGCFAVKNVTVNQQPAAITAPVFDMCEGQSVNLSNAITGGTWNSSNSAIATVSAGSGIVNGIAAAGSLTGVATISYTLPGGCAATHDVSVNPTPAGITGTMAICQTGVTTLSSPTPGGVWAISSPVVASIDVASGEVIGSNVGTATVTYLLGTGCKTTAVVSVNQLPGAISGTLAVCEGLTTTLSNPIGGGAWISDVPTTAGISSAGVVLGSVAGTTLITYQLSNGCYRTAVATVNTTPAAISGASPLCQGAGETLTSSPAGGTWISSVVSIASIDPSTGLVAASAVNSGTASMTYTLPAGCKVTADVVVNQLPAPITGLTQVCETKTITLSNTLAGGTWQSANPFIADVNSSGEVLGVANGTTVISYAMPATSCYRIKVVTVNAQPSAVTGPAAVCQGANATMSSSPTGGVWISSASGIAAVDPMTAVVTASSINSGVAQMIYTLPTGCQSMRDITVDPLPAPITGTLTVCEGSTTNLHSATSGGTWTLSNANALIDAGGLVTGVTSGTADVVFGLSTGCSQSAIVSVNLTPAAITGAPEVCQTAATTLSSMTPGGVWNVGSTYIASIDATSGELTGINAGGTSVTYALATGCNTTSNITVNQLPDAIAGVLQVCETQETTLSNTVGGGAWVSDAPAVASILGTGIITGNASGTANITYTLPTGCSRTAIATVNTLPSSITGTLAVCQGNSTGLTVSPAGGAWTSSTPVVATIDATTGVVTASSALSGMSHIVYTLPEGCYAETDVLVNPLPAPIVGPMTVCEATTATLTNTSTGGIWNADAGGFASVDPTTGVVSGLVPGTATITYTLMTGCERTMEVSVNAAPAPVTGTLTVCQGATTTLSSMTSGGTWSTVIPAVATIGATGVVSGVLSGLTDVNYTLSTGCKQTVMVSVNALPTTYPVSGGGAYCTGGTGVSIGMLGSDADIHYQLYNGSATMGGVAAGTGTTVSFGLQTVAGTYTVTAINYATGCTKAMFGTATISITPTVIPGVALSSSAGTSLCGGIASTYAATPVNGGTLPAYAWEVNGSPISGATSASYSYSPANGDVVKVTLTSNAACADPGTAVDMLTMSVATPVTPSATIAGVSTVCAGSPTLMTATPAFGGAAPSWQWYVNGSIVSGATNSTYSFAPVAGDFVNCTMATSIACNTAPSVNSNTIALLTTPVIVPTVNITVSPGVVIPYGTLATFNALATGAGAGPTFQWFVNGVSITGATSNIYTNSTLHNGDSVTCRVTAIEECGKETFNSVLMGVKGNPTSVDPRVMASDIMLVPNPNTGDFVIKGRVAAQDGEVITVEVTNVLGQTVYTGTLPVKDAQVNGHIKLAHDLANGMYLLNLKNVEVQKSLRFVLER
jgi:uncharacterized protein YjdB